MIGIYLMIAVYALFGLKVLGYYILAQALIILILKSIIILFGKSK